MASGRAALLCAMHLFMLMLCGCSSVGYYAQSVGGQLDVWGRERAIDAVILDPETPGALRERLALVTRIRDFASRELALPDNASYRRYADLERPYVVWNVFAAPALSLTPMQWCFPFTGCVSYRGYFSQAAAERYAAALAAEGHDVYVAGIPAYSTLGWFADPVLNTFIHYPETELARLIFHELAHQVVYVRDDSVFNESFAVAVEQAGVERWIARYGDSAATGRFQQANRRREDFLRLIAGARDQLSRLYATDAPDVEKLSGKSRILDELERDYAKLKTAWGGFGGYDRWFAQRPNNARLASVSIYTQLVPQFRALLDREAGDLPRFYAAVRDLAAEPREQRLARLHSP